MRGPHAFHDAPPTVIVDETASLADTAMIAEAALEDFAFADTVVARDLDEAIPPSGVVIQNEAGLAHCVTLAPRAPMYGALAPPYLLPARDDGFTSKMRLAWARMREGMLASRAEMTELWSATACLEHVHDGRGAIVYDEDPLARARAMGRRVRRFFSFFEWDRADLLRAAWIGVLVFVLVAMAGAFALSPGRARVRALESSANTAADLPSSTHVAR